MPLAATWMDLEIIILWEGSQTEKDKYYVISLTCRIEKKKKIQIYFQNRKRPINFVLSNLFFFF